MQMYYLRDYARKGGKPYSNNRFEVTGPHDYQVCNELPVEVIAVDRREKALNRSKRLLEKNWGKNFDVKIS